MFSKLRVLVALFISLLVVAPKLVHADDKIALVSLQRALNEVEAGKTAKAGLKKDFEAKKKQIDTMKLDLENLSKELEKEKLVLSQEALKTKSQALQTKYMELQTKAAEYERELKEKEAESATKILGSLRKIVNEISAKEGYTLVIENSAETILYSKNAVDITPKVIAAFNSQSQ